MSTLVSVEKINALDVFTSEGVDPILEAINKEIERFDADVTTSKGRKEIASMANKIARTKTFLDGAGKELVSEWKEKAKIVDGSRKKIRDTLDKWKDGVRAPLTEWENNEKARVDSHQHNLNLLLGLGDVDGFSSDQIRKISVITVHHDISPKLSLTNFTIMLGLTWQ